MPEVCSKRCSAAKRRKWRMVLHLTCQMQTCPTGEVRGSKRKGLLKSRSDFFGGTAAQRWGSQNPKGSALVVREGGALSLAVFLYLIHQKQLDMPDGHKRRVVNKL
jgi:hypothetical protein